jgi:LysR family glycine cleavage system transcriptional activator
MRKPLPPLTALRAFEAAARHLSLKHAAEELSVTPAAISHQIQQLESVLDVQLFRRGHRSVALTDIAQVLAQRLQEGFEVLERAVEGVRERRGEGGLLNVISSPSFASYWLMPNLHLFIENNGGVDVQVSTRVRQFSTVPRGPRGDLESVTRWADESDAVITLGDGDYSGLQATKLMGLTITALCSPKYLASIEGLSLHDVARHAKLLHDDRAKIYEGRQFWDIWLSAAGIDNIDTDRGQHFSHAAFAIETAVSGRGIVATTIENAVTAVSSGQLVSPFELRVPWGLSYYLVVSKTSARRSTVQQFSDWLLSLTEKAKSL